ncbi:unnamed protein product [Lampetra fluviatilis]
MGGRGVAYEEFDSGGSYEWEDFPDVARMATACASGNVGSEEDGGIEVALQHRKESKRVEALPARRARGLSTLSLGRVSVCGTTRGKSSRRQSPAA